MTDADEARASVRQRLETVEAALATDLTPAARSAHRAQARLLRRVLQRVEAASTN
jgi:hypothetical protein